MKIEVIPVLDIRGRRVVHAAGGDRRLYQTVKSRLFQGDDPLIAAIAVRDALGLSRFYVADLDAIDGAPPMFDVYRVLCEHNLALWVDAGVRTAADASRLLDCGVAGVVAGLETISGPALLAELVAWAGPSRVVFSLDLRAGVPVVAALSDWRDYTPLAIVRAAVAAGIRRIILLDLARVGSSRGVGTLGLLAASASAFPEVEWVVGGGIAAADDLVQLERAGASAALVGSAIYDGRIGGKELAACGRDAV